MQQFSPGTVLQNGKYRLDNAIGQGFFGFTYIGQHTMFQQKVAIKEYLPQSNADTFIQAAITLSRLQHPGLATIIDVFKEYGRAFIVTSFIEGQTLDRLTAAGPLDTPRAIDYICKIAEAIDSFHQNGINHLDIKPSNIVVRTADNCPVLIEYGIGKNIGYNDPAFNASPVDSNRGYTPIEQYSANITAFSPETDIYALAATLYRLLTATTPPEPIALLAAGRLDFPQTVPQTVRDVISKAMSTAIAGRYHSLQEFTEALRQAFIATPQQPARTTTPPPAPMAAPQPPAFNQPTTPAPPMPAAAPPMPATVPTMSAPTAPAPIPPMPAPSAQPAPMPEPQMPAFERAQRPTPQAPASPAMPPVQPIASDTTQVGNAMPQMPEMPAFIEPAPTAESRDETNGFENFEMDFDMPEFIEQNDTDQSKPEPVNLPEPEPAPVRPATPTVQPEHSAPVASVTEIEMPPFQLDEPEDVELPTETDNDNDNDNSFDIDLEDDEDRSEVSDKAPAPRRSNKRGVMIFGGLILIVVLAVTAVFYFQMSGSDDSKPAPVPADSVGNSLSDNADQPYAISVSDHSMNLFGDACVYTGSLNADSLPDGKGTLVYDATDFQSYTGDFVNGRFEGQGKLLSRNGNLLSGTFSNGLLVDGTYTIKKTGSYYVGTFVNGEAYDGAWYDSNNNQTGTVTAGKYSKKKKVTSHKQTNETHNLNTDTLGNRSYSGRICRSL